MFVRRLLQSAERERLRVRVRVCMCVWVPDLYALTSTFENPTQLAIRLAHPRIFE